jgi:hypothetical protein
MKTDNKVLLARELLESMGSRERYIRMMGKTSIPSVFKGLKEIIVDEADKAVDALMSAIAAIYTSTFSEQDLKGLVDFFNSGAGKRYVEADLEMEGKLADTALAWSRIVLEKAEERYQGEYPKKKAEEGINPKDYIPPLSINRW